MSKMVYTPDDYDRYGVLKVPLSILLIGVYLLKYPIFLTLPVMSNAEYMANFARQQFDWGLLASCVPAFLVLAASARRLPQSGGLTRRIWRYGRELLLSAIAAELLLLTAYVLLGRRQIDEIFLGFVYLDLMFGAYLARSQRIRDVFSEFPVPEAKRGKAEEQPAKDSVPR